MALTLAIYIPVSIVFLLPLDLISTAMPASWALLPPGLVTAAWKATYWTAFFLTWSVLPLLQEFYDSGYFKPGQRLRDSLRTNLKYQGLMLGVGLLGVLYLVFLVGVTLTTLKSLVIALSHSYSLLLALWFMSYGLVNLPRESWALGNPAAHLHRSYARLTHVHDVIGDLRHSLGELALELTQLRAIAQEDYDLQFEFGEWLGELAKRITDQGPLELVERVPSEPVRNPNLVDHGRADLTPQRVVKLARQVHHQLHRYVLATCDFEEAFMEVVKFEDIQTAAVPFRFRYTAGSRSMRVLSRVLPPPLLSFTYRYLIPAGHRVAASALVVLSVVVVESEMLHSTRYSLVDLLSTVSRLATSVVVLSYMCLASILSLRRNRLFNLKYHLNDGGLSDPVSCLFYATYACRLTLPLSYNFLTLLVDRESSFEAFLGKSINLTVLGQGFNNWLPRFILLPLVLNYFNVYERVKDKLGFNMEEEDEEMGAEGGGSRVEEARHIIHQHMAKVGISSTVRPFRLAPREERVAVETYADVQYERNRADFHNLLLSQQPASTPYSTPAPETAPFLGRLGQVARTGEEGAVGVWAGLRASWANLTGSRPGRVFIPPLSDDEEDLVL